MIDEKKFIPLHVRYSEYFRDACIERNRFDLAVHCTLPNNILEDENLLNGYCKELNIAQSNFFIKYKWLKNYYQKNNNVFNSLLATSLRDNIFNLNKNHYERFINYIDIQASLAMLNEIQIQVLSRILDNYSFKDYDVSFMISNIVNNLPHYNQLISSINITELSQEQFKLLVSILQNANNPYNINSLTDLENYITIKKKTLVDNFKENLLESNKTNLLQAIFNIDLEEATYIYEKFCHNATMMSALKNSELPKENYRQLKLIYDIINCNDQTELAQIYNQLHGEIVYNQELPLETYLRSVYSNLYSQSLYNANEKEEVYGPKEHISSKDYYNGQEVQVFIPRTKFKFMTHIVSSVNLDKSFNYANDWLDYPQIQDNIVACSYLTEDELNTFSDNQPGFCFDNFEDGAILAVARTDIDSFVGSATYNSGRIVQELNRSKAQYYVPSELNKISRVAGYNELLIGRRDIRIEDTLTKRAPTQILMITPSLRNGDTITRIDTIFEELSFISEEDKTQLMGLSSDYRYTTKITPILNNYSDIFNWFAEEKGISAKALINHYQQKIINALYYENCLKASSEFNVPLVIVDKEHCFRHILAASEYYDEDMKAKIYNYYVSSSNGIKSKLWDEVCRSNDVSRLLNPDVPILKDYWNEVGDFSDEDYISKLHKSYDANRNPEDVPAHYLKEHFSEYEKYLEEKKRQAEELARQEAEEELARQKKYAEDDELTDGYRYGDIDFEIPDESDWSDCM